MVLSLLCQIFMLQREFIHKKSCVETPQENGIVERKHRHILNVIRLYFLKQIFLQFFWEFAVNHVVFLINAIPTPLLNNISPHEKLFGKPYDISFLKVFGCLCYASTIIAHRKKLDDRSIKGIFLGFPQNTKGYIVLNLKFHSIEISRHVIFHENQFPYKLDSGLLRDPNTLSLLISNAYNFALDFFFWYCTFCRAMCLYSCTQYCPPPISLSSDLSVNSASLSSCIQQFTSTSIITACTSRRHLTPISKKISSSSPTTCLSCQFPHCNQHCK